MNDELKKMEVDHFKRNLRDCNLWCRKIMECNLELEAISVSLYEIPAVSYGEKRFNGKKDTEGLPDYDYVKPEGTSDPYRTPTDSYMQLMYNEEQWVKRRSIYLQSIGDCRVVLNRIDPITKNAIIRMYVCGENYNNIAKELNYSRRGLFDLVEKSIMQALF